MCPTRCWVVVLVFSTFTRALADLKDRLETHMHATRTTLVSAASLAFFAGAAVAATPSITEMAPENAVLVISIDDYSEMRSAIDRSALGTIWRDEAVQDWIADAMQQAIEEASDEMGEIGIDFEDLAEPAGTIGLSVFVEGESFAESEYALLAVADFGDDIESMQEIITKLVERGVEEGDIEVESDTVNGAELWTITPMVDDDTLEFFQSIGEDAPMPTSMFLARSGSALMFSSSLDTIESSVDRINGGGGVDPVSSSSTFQDTMSATGEGDIMVFANFEPLYTLTEQLDRARVADPENDPLFMFPPIAIASLLDAAGLTEVRSLGASASFDADNAAIETTIAVMVPERKGLMTLVPAAPAEFEPPAFVTADAVSFQMVQADFQNLLPAIQNIVGSLPADMQQNVGMPLMMAQGVLGPMLNNLGPEVYIVQTIDKPYAADSSQTLVGISAKDSQGIAQAVTMVAGQIGVAARDFEGFQIWDVSGSPMLGQMAGPGVPEISIGLSGEHMFVGQTSGVEDALRSINADAPALVDEQRFRSAIASIPGEGLAFSWTDTAAGLDYARWMIENLPEIQRQQMIEMFGDDPEMLEMIEEDLADTGMPEFLESLPSFDVITDSIGDMVTHTYITPQGIVTKSYVYNAN